MWSYKKDPQTGDRIKDGRGGYVKTYTAENLVRNQLLAHFGACWQDPELGSLLHDHHRLAASPEALIPEEAKRALERVERAGRISNIEVVAEAAGPGRVNAATKFADIGTGLSVATKVPVGG